MKTIEIEMTIEDLQTVWTLCEKEAKKAKPGSSSQKTFLSLSLYGLTTSKARS